MKTVFKILYQPYKWLIFIPLLGISTCFFVFIGVIVIFLFNDTLANKTTGVWWARFNSYLIPMIVNSSGKENIDKKQSYIVVANHQSNLDIFVLYGWLGIDIKWVIKKELRKVPVFGFAAEIGGNIIIDRSDAQSAYESLKKAKEKIVDGTSIVILPEGTRSQDGNIKEFKKGAFQMALDLNLPVLPVTILNTRNILKPRSFDLFPGAASMIIHEPVDSSDYSNEAIDEFKSHVRAIIENSFLENN